MLHNSRVLRLNTTYRVQVVPAGTSRCIGLARGNTGVGPSVAARNSRPWATTKRRWATTGGRGRRCCVRDTHLHRKMECNIGCGPSSSANCSDAHAVVWLASMLKAVQLFCSTFCFLAEILLFQLQTCVQVGFLLAIVTNKTVATVIP